MKFQIKMIVVYALLGVVAAVIAGSIYYSASVEKINERELRNIAIDAEQLEQQYNEMIVSMKEVSYYLLSDKETLAAITSISNMIRSENTKNYFLEAENTILEQENNDYIKKRFYRVVFCNKNCTPISNRGITQTDYTKMPWYKKAEKSSNPFTYMGIHPDTWEEEQQEKVFSVICHIQGKDMGYIEVQQTLKEVRSKLRTADSGLAVCVMDKEGQIMYRNKELDEDFCKDFFEKKDLHAQKILSGNGIDYLAAGGYNEETKTTILVYKDASVLETDVASVFYMSIFLVGVVMIVSLIYVMISTGQLTRPLRQLQEVMNQTSLENLPQRVELDFSNSGNEFQRMSQAYDDMRERLYKAIIREKQLSDLQTQAQFDMLQVQVNPHFIYNVLNVISGRGMINDDEIICDMCDDLAGMLRYSTNTKEKYASIRAEMTYLELYFSLLKYRYEHKLEYEIKYASCISEQLIPKMVVQQLVENSVNHGFQNSNKAMKIVVEADCKADCWYISVKDNGEGFQENIQNNLEAKLSRLKEELARKNQNIELEIGGMGILNTFARLFLLYGDNLYFEIKNSREGGAEIVFGAKLQ